MAAWSGPGGQGPRLRLCYRLKTCGLIIGKLVKPLPTISPFLQAAIKEVFGEHAYKVPISSTKSMTGHMLEAAGGAEALFTVLAIRDQVMPPTINLDNPDEQCDLDYVPHTAREARIDTAISNSFGFGGTNGTLVFRRFSD